MKGTFIPVLTAASVLTTPLAFADEVTITLDAVQKADTAGDLRWTKTALMQAQAGMNAQTGALRAAQFPAAPQG